MSISGNAPGDSSTSLRRHIEAVHNISRIVSSTLDSDECLQGVLRTAMDGVDAEAGSILLHNERDNTLLFRYVVGEKAAELTGVSIPSDHGLAGKVFQSGKPFLTNSPDKDRHHMSDLDIRLHFHTRNIVTVPLQYREGKPVGVMQILNKITGNFDGDDLGILEIISSVAASALENAKLHREARLAAIAGAVGEISHDMKNKVAPITGWVDTLQPILQDMFDRLDRLAGILEVEKAQALHQATDDTRDLYPEAMEAINYGAREVQDFARVIADCVKGIVTEPQLVEQDLASIIEPQLKGLEPIVQHQGVQIIKSFDAIPSFRFDRYLISRAVYNLVNNAIPETPEGGTIAVSFSYKKNGRFPAGGYVMIEVRDTGRGMPASVLDGILKGDAHSTKATGTGLGTRVVKNAVDAHHGVLEGESTEGKGTTFRIKLPIAV